MKKTEGIFQIRKNRFSIERKTLQFQFNSVHRQRLNDLGNAKHTKHSDIKCAALKSKA